MATTFNAILSSEDVKWRTSACVLAVAALLYLLTRITWRPPFPKTAPPLMEESLPVVGALRFFTSRGNFCRDGASMTKTGNYSFYCGSHRVVGLSGLEGRKTFYDSKELSLHAGYSVLLSAAPDIQTGETVDAFANWFSRKIIKLMKKDNFVKCLPHLVTDTSSALERIASRCGNSSGIFHPFDEMNRIVYQLTMRTVGVTEIAESQELLSRSLSLVGKINENNSTLRIMFPWLPTLKHVKRLIAAGQLYMIIDRIARDRKRTGRREDDTMQFLLDEGESSIKIVYASLYIFRSLSFIILALFAGQLNSGFNAAWVFCYLALDPYWMQEVRSEIDSVIAKHRSSTEQTPLDVLSKLSVDNWERDFPLVNLCLDESIRLVTVGAGFRKNISSKDVEIGHTGEVIPKGAFGAFLIDDIHLDPEIYSNPTKFDPGRFLPGREEDKKVPLAYAGWGLGRHPCLGMRFAKLEHAVITAVSLVTFDFSLCDADGTPVTRAPEIDRNDLVIRNPSVPLRLKYTRRGY
ncbi:MAG: hypothetical protein M1820_008004 [Bogoriella megaspora]|nr:MAG: hypothetical protein M1820_008004 [Bogoriella megaspora]